MSGIMKPEETVEVFETMLQREQPFPQKSPPDPEAILLEAHKKHLAEVNDAIDNLDKSIAIMQSQRDAYMRTRQRLQAGMDLKLPGYLEGTTTKTEY